MNTQETELLEALSDKVRQGQPIEFLEAIAVIHYQENKRREREARSFLGRLKLWVSNFRRVTP